MLERRRGRGGGVLQFRQVNTTIVVLAMQTIDAIASSRTTLCFVVAHRILFFIHASIMAPMNALTIQTLNTTSNAMNSRVANAMMYLSITYRCNELPRSSSLQVSSQQSRAYDTPRMNIECHHPRFPAYCGRVDS